jgi:LacI family transcriptional regulator
MKSPGRNSKGKITIREVAKSAGVSVGTASRVLNRSTNVDPKLKTAVEAAVVELGYRPSILAQNMKSGAKRTIGILLTDITMPSLATVFRAAQDECSSAGYSVLLGCHEYKRDREFELLKFLSERVDGLIMSTCSETDPGLIALRKSLTIPVVLRDRDNPANASSVRVAHHDAAKRATDYLLDLGHRRIALITGEPPLYPAHARIAGYEAALAARGLLDSAKHISTKGFDLSGRLSDLSKILNKPSRPTALILGGVGLLPEALQTIRAHQLRIPQDISLIASTETDLAALATPPVTVIRWSDVDVGRLCAQILLSRLKPENDATPLHILIETELVVRGSCAPPNADL